MRSYQIRYRKSNKNRKRISRLIIRLSHLIKLIKQNINQIQIMMAFLIQNSSLIRICLMYNKMLTITLWGKLHLKQILNHNQLNKTKWFSIALHHNLKRKKKNPSSLQLRTPVPKHLWLLKRKKKDVKWMIISCMETVAAITAMMLDFSRNYSSLMKIYQIKIGSMSHRGRMNKISKFFKVEDLRPNPPI